MVCTGQVPLPKRNLVSKLTRVLSAGLHVSMLEEHALVKALRENHHYYGFLKLNKNLNVYGYRHILLKIEYYDVNIENMIF